MAKKSDELDQAPSLLFNCYWFSSQLFAFWFTCGRSSLSTRVWCCIQQIKLLICNFFICTTNDKSSFTKLQMSWFCQETACRRHVICNLVNENSSNIEVAVNSDNYLSSITNNWKNYSHRLHLHAHMKLRRLKRLGNGVWCQGKLFIDFFRKCRHAELYDFPAGRKRSRSFAFCYLFQRKY